MENLTHALYMAFAVFVFIIAFTLTLYMVNKLNKQIWTALTLVLFGFAGNNNVNAEGSEIMNHRIAVKGSFSMPFTKYDDTFNKLTGLAGNDAKKSENFKWAAGGGVEYDYFFNPYFGLGGEGLAGYQKLAKYSFGKATATPAKESEEAKPAGEAKKEEGKEVVFSGFYLNPSLVLSSNFLTDGFTFDEEEGCASSLKAGANVKIGANFNFGKVDYSKVDGFSDEKKQAKLPLCTFAVEPSLYAELPLGLGLEVGYRMGLFGDILKVKDFDGCEVSFELESDSMCHAGGISSTIIVVIVIL